MNNLQSLTIEQLAERAKDLNLIEGYRREGDTIVIDQGNIETGFAERQAKAFLRGLIKAGQRRWPL